MSVLTIWFALLFTPVPTANPPAVTAFPLMLPAIVLENVLAPAIVCAPDVLTTVELTVMLSLLAVIPSPPITFSVTVPEYPPPVKPVPPITPVISPTGTPATALSTYSLLAASVLDETVSIPCIRPVPLKTI